MTSPKALAKDVLELMENVSTITYKDGDRWEMSEDEPEHPMVPRLRSIVHAPSFPNDDGHVLRETMDMVLDERRALGTLRAYFQDLRELCLSRGMVDCEDPLTWLAKKLDT